MRLHIQECSADPAGVRRAIDAGGLHSISPRVPYCHGTEAETGTQAERAGELRRCTVLLYTPFKGAFPTPATQSNITKLKPELEKLIKKGERALLALAAETDPEVSKTLKDKGVDLPDFKTGYDAWYSVAMQVVKQLIPDRLPDFVRQYKDDKRKEINPATYGISDYMIGISTSQYDKVIADGKSAFPKFEQQLYILKAALSRFESSLFDIIEIVQADLFDNELEAAQALNRKGFARAAGALAGVVLERHLGRIVEKHGLKQRKASPTINDFNQLLKDNNVIETETWRFIQHLGDLRNLCDHDKGRDPTKDQVEDLIAGVSKIIKTIF